MKSLSLSIITRKIIPGIFRRQQYVGAFTKKSEIFCVLEIFDFHDIGQQEFAAARHNWAALNAITNAPYCGRLNKVQFNDASP